MTIPSPPALLSPLTSEQLAKLQEAIRDYTPAQLSWLSGYFWGMAANAQPTAIAALAQNPGTIAPAITVISASQTGNARRVAEQLCDELNAAQLNATLINAGEFKFKQIAQHPWLLLVVSTQGEGEVPEEAVALHKYVMSKKAPRLESSAFAVMALGDTSYEYFCQAGKDFDQRLAELGAERLLDRVDADVDFSDAAQAWRKNVVAVLAQRVEQSSPLSATHHDVAQRVEQRVYTKENPLHAILSVNQKITGRDSGKDIHHLEIDLGDSGLHYQPGDALGIWYRNDPALVDEIIGLVWRQGEETVSVNGQSMTLRAALTDHRELTQNTTVIVENYAVLSKNESLIERLADKSQLQHYAQTTPLVEMLRQAPADLDAEQLVALLRPLTPRLYSISSAQDEVGSEVHITVGAVRYHIEGRLRSGGASSYLIDRVQEDDEVRVFIEHNDNFRLPANPATPVIMIGPGTGIAPFRAFIQQRAAQGGAGKNWLFFGNPHFTEDFLYQVEWQSYVKEGVLDRIDLAWSRDGEHKVYVQDKLREQAVELWRWLGEGAHLYVCGDANRMAKDVEQALIEIIAQQGGMDAEQADEFLSELRVERRYQRDVY